MRSRRRVAVHAALYSLGLVGLVAAGCALSTRLTAASHRAQSYRDPVTATWRRTREATREHRDIHQAVWRRDALAVAGFLLQGGDVDELDRINQTPLHLAALLGHDDIAGLLISAGADVDARGNGGQTPLHNAMIAMGNCFCPLKGDPAGKLRVADLLVEHGADVNAADRQGWTPLHLAASGVWRGAEFTRVLVRRGAGLDARDRWGQTPLHVAALNKQHAIAEFLITSGADVEARDKEGRTALTLLGCSDPGRDQVVAPQDWAYLR